MRFPRMAYTSVAVDASALPSTAGIRACERGTPALSAYLHICRGLVPNVHHEEIVCNEATLSHTLVVSHCGVIVGGITFRMLVAAPDRGRGAPTRAPCARAPRRRAPRHALQPATHTSENC